ncbi:MAG: hypothetical protein C75L2_00020043 [Leptospirillum sp. Group II 'C75']|jgi:hypothetical protein|uniref:TRL domain-containing protein n=1 Tax=Leptospirillum sp. Group II 'CF-1' TaxID=1660083 RepID=UPI00029CCD60|nr:TRL domain-containing protein [Leptospirillum sp. Group II 'CF-1']AKS22864.1 hypothetical protein ABH19_02510 [Leptospirillum sp. Group II 'CF-1']EIJ75145.1 MAG: hypothetical protein C75L2_00020043 [Leptospirillum sp. Group II 'C75']
MKKRTILASLFFGTVLLGGCTLAMPEAPMNPMVETNKPAGLKSTEVCNGTFAADTETGSGDTIREAARKAGIKKIFSIQYETKNYIFFTRFCAVVKGT